MAKSKPLIVYLKPADKMKLQAVAMMRKMSQSFILVEAVQDAFAAAFGRTADPRSVLERYGPMSAGQVVTTQRAKRRRVSPSTNSPPQSKKPQCPLSVAYKITNVDQAAR